ncbi:MAG: hypothetical protein WBL61_22320, partial [Bryobacteraceae bacterium]
SAPGSATPPEHRTHSNPNPLTGPSKQDISTLLGIGHFYFALTRQADTILFLTMALARLNEPAARNAGVTRNRSFFP